MCNLLLVNFIFNVTKLEENYLSPDNFPAIVDFEIIVPADSYFVMEDNRQASKDSRRFCSNFRETHYWQG